MLFTGSAREAVPMPRIPCVEQSICTGCELCEQICPEVFRMNDDGVSEVYNPQGASEDKIQEAIDSCPVQCISWIDE
jgi:ferredoxin